MKVFWIGFAIFIFTSISSFGQTQPLDTDGNGYMNIKTLDDLKWISENEDSWSWDFELANNIDASDTRNWNIGDHDNNPQTPDSAMGWKPIGRYYHSYTGKFKGNGFSISNLYINRPKDDCIGFFGSIYCNDIVDLTINDCKITGRYYVGGISGFTDSDPYNVQIPEMAYIKYSSVSGKIKGKNEVGGFIGYLEAIVHDCYCRAEVIGDSLVGGFIGFSIGGIERCYSAGTVSGISKNSIPQGFVGEAMFLAFDNYNGFEGCYWDKEIAGVTTSEGGGTGLSTSEMKTKKTYIEGDEYSHSRIWDFEEIWHIDESINDGYPFLRVHSVGIKEEKFYSEKEITIYPNPASDKVRISSKEAIVDYTKIMIYDVSGKLVYSGSAGDIDISDFPAGVYFVVDDTCLWLGKFIKQ
jgi:hypothetical protein